MINIVWILLIFLGLAVGVCSGRIEAVTQGALDSAAYAAELCIGLIGIYALWLGLMRVADKSGLVLGISRRMAPVLRLLFPRVPPKGPALGAISMNIMANMLGLGNAATPLGLKAMKELQRLNPDRSTASDEMCMLLVINTSSIQLIPATVVALRSAAGSANPAEIIGTAFLATCCSTLAGIAAVLLLKKRRNVQHIDGQKRTVRNK